MAYERWVVAQRTLARSAVRELLAHFGGPAADAGVKATALGTVRSLESSWARGARDVCDTTVSPQSPQLLPHPEPRLALSGSALCLVGRLLRRAAADHVRVHERLPDSH